MVHWVTNAVSSVEHRNIESLLLDSISPIGGVEDEFGGFVSVCFDPFLFWDEIEEGVGKQGEA